MVQNLVINTIFNCSSGKEEPAILPPSSAHDGGGNFFFGNSFSGNHKVDISIMILSLNPVQIFFSKQHMMSC